MHTHMFPAPPHPPTHPHTHTHMPPSPPSHSPPHCLNQVRLLVGPAPTSALHTHAPPPTHTHTRAHARAHTHALPMPGEAISQEYHQPTNQPTHCLYQVNLLVGAAANSSSQIVAREAVLIDLLQKTNFALQAQLAAATAVGMSMSQVGGRGRGRRRGEGLSEPLSAEYVSCPNMYTHTHTCTWAPCIQLMTIIISATAKPQVQALSACCC